MATAPAARPATAASKTADWVDWAEAIPITSPLVEMRPSLAPSVAARSQPDRPLRCDSPRVADASLVANRMPPYDLGPRAWCRPLAVGLQKIPLGNAGHR